VRKTKTEVKTWCGKDLANDLAKHLESPTCMTWVEVPLGSVWNGVPRADVLAINKSYSNPLVRIYEVKVSRGDFWGDINRDKYTGYAKYAHQVYFAVPSGLVHVGELPQDGTGLIVRNDSTWHVVKAARRNSIKLDVELLLKLLMKGYEDHYQKHRSEGKRTEDAKIYTTLRQAYYDYGVKVANDISHAQEIVETAESIKAEIGKLMGKNYNDVISAAGELKNDIDKLMAEKKGYRLALPCAQLAIRLFNGEIFWGNPARELRKLAEQAEKEFPEVK